MELALGRHDGGPSPVSSGQRIGALKVWRGSNLAVEMPVFATAPMVILYIVFQRYFIQGLMAGAVK